MIKNSDSYINKRLKKGLGSINFIIVFFSLLLGGAAVFGILRSRTKPTPPPVVVQNTAPTAPAPSFKTTKDNDPAQKQGTFDMVQISIPPDAAGGLCEEGGANNEPEILVGFSPAAGETVGAGGQIKVWVNDEGAPFIALNEQVDPVTGQVTTPGDRTGKAGDGYLWEPALYILPQTAEAGGTPHFPSIIKGEYNNKPPSKGKGIVGAAIDPMPPGASKSEKYLAEFIWDVNSLGLVAGSYVAEFVIHDGDDDRGVGCININIL